MLIQVDIDATLYDSDPVFAECSAEAGINWPEGYTWWMTPADYGTTVEEILKVFHKAHSEEYIMKQEPYPFAALALNELAERYPVEIAYVSDRDPSQTEALEEWLEIHGFLRAGERVVTTRDKRHWMREHRPEVVIDDRVRTILMARYELGSSVYVMQHPHNVNLKGEADFIYVVSDWQELGSLLQQQLSERFIRV